MTTTIFVVGAAFLAWLAADAMSGGHDAAPRAADRVPQIDLRGKALDAEILRLHERLAPATPPLHASRDLFRFHEPPPRPAAVSRPVLSEAAAMPEQPVPLPLKFIGVAEDPGPAGPVRTAIISGVNELYTVREGQNVTPRYRVAKISADVVELDDLITHGTLRLALK